MNYYEMLLARKLAKGELPPNAYLLKTASGSLVSFSDGANLPMPSFVCKIDAVQSGSGEPSPENIRPISGHTGVNAWVRGKNLFDRTLMVSPTTSAKWVQVQLKPNTTYTVSSNIPNSYTSAYIFAIAGTDVSGVTSGVNGVGQNRPQKITTGADGILSFGYRTNGDSGVLDLDDYYYQIELGETATTYEPYNPNSQTIQVSWQTEAGEVFGGYVDLVSGVLTVTHKSQTGFTRGSQDSSNKLYNIGTISDMKAYTNASVISPYFIDSMFEKLSVQGARAAETPSITHYNKALYVGGYIGKEAELDTLLESLQVKYELATPITYQLTPTQIKSLLGKNNAWCDTGDVDIEYFGKGAD